MTDPRLRLRRRALASTAVVADVAFAVNTWLTLTVDNAGAFAGHVVFGLAAGYVAMMALALLYWMSDD